jgi:predicted acyl esterase
MRHALAVVLSASTGLGAVALEAQRVSRTGEYRGYSSPRYDGWQRSSEYLTMRDGVRLAVDIYRSTTNGTLHTERLPVLWSHVRYQRSFIRDDSLGPFFGSIGLERAPATYLASVNRSLGVLPMMFPRRGQ